MATTSTRTRRAYRRTDLPKDESSDASARLTLVHEPLPAPADLDGKAVIIKQHAVALNYRDANMVHGTNPWPTIAHGIPCSDGVGEVVQIGAEVTDVRVGDRVCTIIDQASFTGREQARSWLAADVDGVLADYIVVDDERVLVRIPDHLAWDEASVLPCAGLTAWMALKGLQTGSVVLIQGTGGVSLLALKLARAAGHKVIISSSSDTKLARLQDKYASPTLLTVNYATYPSSWHEKIIEMNGGVGVDLVLENGGSSSLLQSLQCTKRGGIVSQVGYLGKQDGRHLDGLVPLLIDRRVNLRGINAGSKHDLEDFYAAVSATQMRFDDVIDATFSFEEAPEAILHVWHGKQVGKVVVQVKHAE